MGLADILQLSETAIKISVDIPDALSMVNEAAANVEGFAHDIAVIYEKMPLFDYTNFCFYAYNSAQLFQRMLGMDAREYTSFSLDAPDGFFYTLYGGMAALYPQAQSVLAEEK